MTEDAKVGVVDPEVVIIKPEGDRVLPATQGERGGRGGGGKPPLRTAVGYFGDEGEEQPSPQKKAEKFMSLWTAPVPLRQSQIEQQERELDISLVATGLTDPAQMFLRKIYHQASIESRAPESLLHASLLNIDVEGQRYGPFDQKPDRAEIETRLINFFRRSLVAKSTPEDQSLYSEWVSVHRSTYSS